MSNPLCICYILKHTTFLPPHVNNSKYEITSLSSWKEILKETVAKSAKKLNIMEKTSNCCKLTDNLKQYHYRKKLYVMNDVILQHSKKPASVWLVR
jgi:hypothetical protein